MNKIKVLAASDLHGDSSQILKLAELSLKENVDLVILCGDLTSPIQRNNIIKPFTDRNKKVLFVPGNHDGFALGDFLSEFYKVKNLHSSYFVHNNIGFFGCGGANIGFDALSEIEIYDTMKNSFASLKYLDRKIMVSHVHPHGTIVDRLIPNIGSIGLRKAIEKLQPELVLCGHVHEAEGLEDNIGKTKVMNVGRNGKIFYL